MSTNMGTIFSWQYLSEWSPTPVWVRPEGCHEYTWPNSPSIPVRTWEPFSFQSKKRLGLPGVPEPWDAPLLLGLRSVPALSHLRLPFHTRKTLANTFLEFPRPSSEGQGVGRATWEMRQGWTWGRSPSPGLCSSWSLLLGFPGVIITARTVSQALFYILILTTSTQWRRAQVLTMACWALVSHFLSKLIS